MLKKWGSLAWRLLDCVLITGGIFWLVAIGGNLLRDPVIERWLRIYGRRQLSR